MPRIAREDHAAIRHRIDTEGQKVADVAAAYGCTPANIYAILARLRRQDSQGTGEAPPPAAEPAPADLFGGNPAPIAPEPPARAPVAPPMDPPAPSIAAPELPFAPVPPPARTVPAPRPAAAAPRAGKAGYALLMRTGDGEEAVNPFRSLDELLSAAKPILRTAARSPEPIWFSIQQVDLDTLEDSF